MLIAKYLPVPGRSIQEGDLIEHPVTKNRMIAKKEDGLDYLNNKTAWAVIEFCLCKRDMVHAPERGPMGWKYQYTRLGKISPEAIWVKEGDELHEYEVKMYTDYASTPMETTLVRVKGPCGHFH